MNSLERIFWQKVDKKDDNECWPWLANKTVSGYGSFTISAHRLAYYFLKGPVPDGLVLDHLCRNRACVNPNHLEAITKKANDLRGESIFAIEARRTHCAKGHPLIEGNLIPAQLKRGHRDCRICHNARQRAYYWKHTEHIKRQHKEYRSGRGHKNERPESAL